MSFLFDYSTSVFVGGVVILLVLGTVSRSSNADQRAAAAAYTKQQALELATWMEEDLSTAGMGLEDGETRFVLPTESGTGPQRKTTSFVFARRSYDFSTSTPTIQNTDIRYVLQPTTIVQIDGTDVQLYEIQRSERTGSSTWQPAGSTPTNLSHFLLTMKAQDGSVATSEADAAFVDVEFTMIPTLMREESTVPELHWSTAFRLHPY